MTLLQQIEAEMASRKTTLQACKDAAVNQPAYYSGAEGMRQLEEKPGRTTDPDLKNGTVRAAAWVAEDGLTCYSCHRATTGSMSIARCAGKYVDRKDTITTANPTGVRTSGLPWTGLNIEATNLGSGKASVSPMPHPMIANKPPASG